MESKKQKVMQFISANPGWSARAVVDKFNLDWGLGQDYGNGIAEVVFYTDESQREEVMRLHDDINAWFR